MGAKFLCCLPLRLGVLLFTMIQFLLAGAVAGLLWFGLFFLKKDNIWSTVAQSMKTTVIIVASVYSAVAIIALLGFLGAIFKKYALVATYFTVHCFAVGFQIGSGIWYLVNFYRTRSQTFEDCVGNSNAPERTTFCASMEQVKKVPQGGVIASIIVPIVISLYTVYVIYFYMQRLKEQKEGPKDAFHGHRSIPSYAPLQKSEETYPLTQPNVTYPYSDATHSFGAQATPANKV